MSIFQPIIASQNSDVSTISVVLNKNMQRISKILGSIWSDKSDTIELGKEIYDQLYAEYISLGGSGIKPKSKIYTITVNENLYHLMFLDFQFDKANDLGTNWMLELHYSLVVWTPNKNIYSVKDCSSNYIQYDLRSIKNDVFVLNHFSKIDGHETLKPFTDDIPEEVKTSGVFTRVSINYGEVLKTNMTLTKRFDSLTTITF